MKLTRTASAIVAAPREHVVATTVRTDLEAVRFYDSRVERVETNGVPDGTAGQVVRLTARVWGQEVELVQTLLVAELPERLQDRMDTLDGAILTEIRFVAVDPSTTRLDMTISYEIALWRVFQLVGTALTLRSQLGKSIARFKEFAELTYRAD